MDSWEEFWVEAHRALLWSVAVHVYMFNRRPFVKEKDGIAKVFFVCVGVMVVVWVYCFTLSLLFGPYGWVIVLAGIIGREGNNFSVMMAGLPYDFTGAVRLHREEFFNHLSKCIEDELSKFLEYSWKQRIIQQAADSARRARSGPHAPVPTPDRLPRVARSQHGYEQESDVNSDDSDNDAENVAVDMQQ